MTAIPLKPNPVLLEALQVRRSVPAKRLSAPGPTQDELLRMLAAAVRVPDHGKRVPFRFLSVSGDARDALGAAVAARGADLRPDAGEAEAAKDRARFSHAPLVIVVVAVLDPDDAKIPEQERLLTAGCTCFALLQAAQGLGYGASWLTGWPAYDPEVRRLLGLSGHERIAGFIHVGTPPGEATGDRERPDPAALLRTWTPPA